MTDSTIVNTDKSQTIAPQSGSRESNYASLAQLALRWETGAALLLIAIVQQCLGFHNPDNSWLFTVAERYLDGGRIYSDLIETNPPASFLIYVPAIAAGRLLQLPAEFMVSAFVFIAALGSLLLALRIAVQAQLIGENQKHLVRNAGIFALLTLPGICFAQREHIALIAFVPVLFVYAVRMNAMAVSVPLALTAGLMAGIGVSIKPHFALVMALPFFIALWRTRVFPLFWQPENIAAALVVMAYAASIFLVFPDFLTYLPVLLDTYLKANVRLSLVLLEVPFLAGIALVVSVIYVSRSSVLSPLGISTLAGALGFMVAALVQSKGWINHFQPGLSLSFLALVVAVWPAIQYHARLSGEDTEPAEQSSGAEPAEGLRATGWIAACVALPAIFLLPMIMSAPQQFAGMEAHPGLRAAVLRLAPKNPKIHAISIDLGVPFPLVRQVNGTWAGTTHIQWLMATARYLKDKGRADLVKMQAYVDQDAQMFAASVRERKPDIILVDQGPHIDKIKQHPAVAAAIALYRKAETVGAITILVPRKR